MRSTSKLLVVGAVIGIVAIAKTHRHHPLHSHRHPRDHRGHHGPPPLLDRPEWRGLTADEARTRLADRLEDTAAVDDAVAYLDERGYLARAT